MMFDVTVVIQWKSSIFYPNIFYDSASLVLTAVEDFKLLEIENTVIRKLTIKLTQVRNLSL